MELKKAVVALAALAQSTRLEVFRLLIKHEPEGLAAGELARLLAIPQNTMSSHLSVLSRARLVSAERFGRSIVYRVDLESFRAVMLFMLKDCCNGRPEICTPLIEDLASGCPPASKKRAHAKL
ncbi:metalloregulator ArsR/SmtB family transcription factor [Bradyrhizobium sp.]|uniref:ArsR/SmtB family transcription factor n=1 Tax=Bradyrhizobium sp. TaxID=376 RepID=UPI0026321342|nr:metalloregulator ArsR/SmtB family transcription factor [Bradyrhizobium sp.]